MPPDLQRCGKAVENALDTYALISRQSVALNAKSGASHLEALDGALRLFKHLALKARNLALAGALLLLCF
jgi:hypothetical protein